MRLRTAAGVFFAASALVILPLVVTDCASDTFVTGSSSGGGDGAAPSAEAAAIDATLDASADAPSSSYCGSSSHGLCFDFDEGDGLARLLVAAGNGGTAAVDATQATSPPRSAHFTLEASGRPRADFVAVLPPNAGNISCHFALYVTALPPATDILAVAFDAADPSLMEYTLSLGLRQGDGYLRELGTFTDSRAINTTNELSAAPPLNGWHAIDIALSLSARTAAVKVDQISVATVSLKPTAGHFTNLTFGAIPTNDVGGGTELRFDDVSCDAPSD